jgi:hypothetical protein
VQGYSFIVERALGEQTGAIRIDMTQYGFTVDSENPMGGEDADQAVVPADAAPGIPAAPASPISHVSA